MQVERITTSERLQEIEESWRALYERAPDVSPFQHPEWLLSWWRHLGVGELRALAMWEDGRLIALAPLLLQPWRDLRQITFLGGGSSDWMGILAEPDRSREATMTMLRYLGETQPEWDVCDFQGLPKASSLCEAAYPGMLEFIRSQPACPVALLPVRRAVPQAARRVDLHIEKVATPTEFESAWVAMPDKEASPAERAFQREALMALWNCGIARLYRGLVGGQTVAALVGFIDKSRFWSFRCDVDPTRRGFNLLHALLEFAMADSLREGARVFDFPRAAEKLPWPVRMENSYQVVLRPLRESALRQAS